MDSQKRPASDAQRASGAKRQKFGTDGSKMSFAQKMMAKMGHVEGGGLGREGHGMLNPIEVKLRPQGAGVGAVKEKTPQAKVEARRAAEQRGEQFEDSSDEEKRARRRRKEAGRSSRSGHAMTDAPSRPRQKIRTAAEIEAEDGLAVPTVFKSIIDHTGAQPRLLTSNSSTIVLESSMLTPAESEAAKVSKAARRELEAFAAAWKDLQERKKYVDIQERQVHEMLDKQKTEELHLRELATAVDQIVASAPNRVTFDRQEAHESQIDALFSRLQQLSHDFADDVERYQLADVAVSVFRPLLTESLSDWNVFEDSPWILPYLNRLKLLLEPAVDHLARDSDTDRTSIPPQSQVSAYVALFYTLWLPRMRVAITNDWNVFDPAPLLSIMRSWDDVLPPKIRDTVVNQLVVQKLFSGLRSWKPGAVRVNDEASRDPQSWIFPWLEYIDNYHLDPRNTGGLFAEVRSKFRSAFDSWNPSRPFIHDLRIWREVKSLRHELNRDLELRMLPRLAQYLHDTFEVDPSDQDVTPIEKVLEWSPFVRPDKFCRILIDAFFPKWLNVLHLWLTSEPNYEEVGQWYTWWQQQLPERLNNVAAVATEWEKGLQMMNEAMSLGPERTKTHLSQPVPAATQQDRPSTSEPTRKPEDPKAALPEITTLKDDLEELCERDSLLMVATRKAHPETGLPIFRITASASGTGGILIYIKGDVTYAQDKRNKNIWDPLDIYADGLLARLAEMK
ncbi:MAG: hypothetical protein M1828_001029 [Chrysothrix sp. TS-e1954]|nr:MAG: hypothetical protein M1828_001029 [Chrysothrix sp. TS-e1954]